MGPLLHLHGRSKLENGDGITLLSQLKLIAEKI